MSQRIKTKNLKLAEVRLFDTERMASEIPSVRGYTYLFQGEDGVYVNIFHPLMEFPVYERVPYSNTTLDGEDYGSKIQLVQGHDCDGPCYIVENADLQSLLGKESISMDELKKSIIESQNFFLDRKDILDEEPFHFSTFLCYRQIREKDEILMSSFEQYLGVPVKKLSLLKK